MKQINFKLLAKEDLSLLHRWFQVAHVKQWYARGETYLLKDIEAKYLPRLTDPFIQSYLAYFNQTAIGYIQIYHLPHYLPENLPLAVIQKMQLFDVNKTLGLDVFFAEIAFLGKGISSQVFSTFFKMCMPDGIENVIVDPLKINTKAIAFFKKHQFQPLGFGIDIENCHLLKNLHCTHE